MKTILLLRREMMDVINRFHEWHRSIMCRTHSDGYTSYIAVNVKIRGSMYIDIDDLIEEKYPKLSDTSKELIREEFTESHMSDLYTQWIEDQARYFIDQFLKGYTHSTREWYRERLYKKIVTGEETDYPALDELPDKKSKLRMMMRWVRKDEEALEHQSNLNHDEIGFFGRSGGWLALERADTVYEWKQEVPEPEELVKYTKDELYPVYVTAKRYLEKLLAIEWAYNQAQDMIPTRKMWKEELLFRMEEFIQPILERSDDSLKRHVKKLKGWIKHKVPVSKRMPYIKPIL
jgi:hypothetical protein